jgi:hypothetical protein
MLVKINNLIIETMNVTYIIDRDVHMNNGKSFTLLEPEIQELLAVMFETPRVETMVMPEEGTQAIKKTITRKKK